MKKVIAGWFALMLILISFEAIPARTRISEAEVIGGEWFKRLGLGGSTDRLSSCEDGLLLFNMGRYEESKRIFLALALGNPCANYWLARQLDEGLGISKDRETALVFFRLSSSKGYAHMTNIPLGRVSQKDEREYAVSESDLARGQPWKVVESPSLSLERATRNLLDALNKDGNRYGMEDISKIELRRPGVRWLRDYWYYQFEIWPHADRLSFRYETVRRVIVLADGTVPKPRHRLKHGEAFKFVPRSYEHTPQAVVARSSKPNAHLSTLREAYGHYFSVKTVQMLCGDQYSDTQRANVSRWLAENELAVQQIELRAFEELGENVNGLKPELPSAKWVIDFLIDKLLRLRFEDEPALFCEKSAARLESPGKLKPLRPLLDQLKDLSQ